MANYYRGEVTVSVAGRAYTLRPTFQILCEIEERIGLKLPQLLRRVACKGLLASEILMLLAIATRHDGSRAFESEAFLDMPAEKVDLHPLLPALAKFLLGALGGQAGDGRAREETGEKAPEGLDYGALMELAWLRFRLEPQVFWALTMPELRRLLRGVMPGRAQSEEVEALMRRFPDGLGCGHTHPNPLHEGGGIFAGGSP